MARQDRLPLLVESMSWEEIAPDALQEARRLTKGSYELLPEYRGALRPEKFHTTDPDAIDRLLINSAGDPALPETWEARCCITVLYPQVLDHLDRRYAQHMIARRRAPFVEWVDEACGNSRNRVLMHALMDLAIGKNRHMPKKVIGTFPTYFRKIHDPLVTLSVMHPEHAGDLLRMQQHEPFADDKSPAVSEARQKLMTNWIRHYHGLDLNDRNQHRLLMKTCRSTETGGDFMALHQLADMRRDPKRARDQFTYPDDWDVMPGWVAHLPEQAFAGAREGKGLLELVGVQKSN